MALSYQEWLDSQRAPAGSRIGGPYKPVFKVDDPNQVLYPVNTTLASQTVSSPNGRPMVAGRGTPATTLRATGKGVDWSKVSDGVNNAVPYISNTINAFRRPMQPRVPATTDYITAPKISYAAQKAETLRKMQGFNKNLDMSLDENSAAAVKAANNVGSIRELNTLGQEETNANEGARFQANQANAGIQTQNNYLMNGYYRDVVDANNAQQREQSQNIANAADKVVFQQNEKAKRDLDLMKLKAYTPLWQKSGVFNRYVDNLSGDESYDKWLEGSGLKSTKANGGRIKVYATGGELGDPDPGKPVKRGTALVPFGVGRRTTDPSYYQSQADTKLHAYDELNRTVAQGLDPYKAIDGGNEKGIATKGSLYGAMSGLDENEARQLFTSAVTTFNDPVYKNLTPQQRLARYYATQGTESFKQKAANYTGTNDYASVVNSSPMKIYKNGGRIKAFK